MLRALKDGELSAVEVNDGEPIMGNYHSRSVEVEEEEEEGPSQFPQPTCS